MLTVTSQSLILSNAACLDHQLYTSGNTIQLDVYFAVFNLIT